MWHVLPKDAGLEFVFQEQSYSSLHSGRSLACDHFRGNIDDPCDGGTVPEAIGSPARSPIVARLTKHHETHVKHHETQVKHCDTS